MQYYCVRPRATQCLTHKSIQKWRCVQIACGTVIPFPLSTMSHISPPGKFISFPAVFTLKQLQIDVLCVKDLDRNARRDINRAIRHEQKRVVTFVCSTQTYQLLGTEFIGLGARFGQDQRNEVEFVKTI